MRTFSKLASVSQRTCSKLLYNLGKRDPTFPESLIMTLYSSQIFGAVSVTLNMNERHFDAEPCNSDSLRSKVILHPSITNNLTPISIMRTLNINRKISHATGQRGHHFPTLHFKNKCIFLSKSAVCSCKKFHPHNPRAF